MEKKITADANFFQTQVVYDTEKTISFLEKAHKLKTYTYQSDALKK